MGGEVIIVTRDPDLQAGGTQQALAVPKQKLPKVSMTQVTLSYSDEATSTDIASAVSKALHLSDTLKTGG